MRSRLHLCQAIRDPQTVGTCSDDLCNNAIRGIGWPLSRMCLSPGLLSRTKLRCRQLNRRCRVRLRERLERCRSGMSHILSVEREEVDIAF